MSSIEDPRSNAASDGWGEVEATRSSSLTDDEMAPLYTSKEGTVEAEGRGEEASFKADEAIYLAPAQRGRGSHADAANGASITSHPERRTARITRSRLQSTNCHDQLNGGNEFQEQVSTSL
jgi:hypothetical protein